MAGQGISFEEWGGVDQIEGRRMARDPDVGPLSLRVMFAALGWSNLIGHAEFAAGGLGTVLQSSDPKVGGLRIPTERGVNKAIEEAKARGLVAPDSNVRCLVAPHWWIKAGGKGGRTCGEHHIRVRRTRQKVAPPASEREQIVPTATEIREQIVPITGTDRSRRDSLTSNDAKSLYDSDLCSAQPHEESA